MALSKVNPNFVSQNLGRRNLLINGDFKVAQRGTTFTTAASGTMVSDRWSNLIGGGAGGTVGFTRSEDAPEGFKYSTKLDVSTAMSSLASGDFYIFKYKGFERQDIEHLNFGTSDAKQLTLSFWVKSNKTGTMYAELQVPTSSATMELSRPYTINAANTWEKKTLTWIPNTAHTPNSAENGAGMYLYMWIASGSNQTGSPLATTWNNNSNRTTGITNYLDSTSNEIYFTGFQLEVGDTATEFEHRTHGDVLAACQRYYYQIGGASQGGDGFQYLAHGFADNSSRAIHLVPFPHDMRAAPTFVCSQTAGEFYWRAHIGNPTSPTATAIPTLATSTVRMARVDCNSSGFNTVGAGLFFEQKNSVNTFIAFSAEL